jgi:hypothetical protein
MTITFNLTRPIHQERALRLGQAWDVRVLCGLFAAAEAGLEERVGG